MTKAVALKVVDMLQTLNVPFTYSHFKKETSVPFITYKFDGRDDFEADDINYHKIVDVRIDLYTRMLDLDLEEQLEQLFEDNELTYSVSDFYIESEDVFQKIYEMRFL